jgi:hypothetical protein
VGNVIERQRNGALRDHLGKAEIQTGHVEHNRHEVDFSHVTSSPFSNRRQATASEVAVQVREPVARFPEVTV